MKAFVIILQSGRTIGPFSTRKIAEEYADYFYPPGSFRELVDIAQVQEPLSYPRHKGYR